MPMREFEVGESILEGKYKECLVCEKLFNHKEKIVLCPLQEPVRGFALVRCIPIHTKCYYVEDKD